jgi:hypothetical protein
VDKQRYDEFRGELMQECVAEIGSGSVEHPTPMTDDEWVDRSSLLADMTPEQFMNAVDRLLVRGFTEDEIEEGLGLMKMGLPASGSGDWSTESLGDANS